MNGATARPLTLFLCGDVMLGRGVDQILPRPGDPALRERQASDAEVYVSLAEVANGPIPRPVDFAWPWGDALAELDAADPDVRLVNLETSVTSRDDFWPAKAVHYRMNPANLPCLRAAWPDACALANNHTLDFGRHGLVETLDALAEAGLRAVGAGRTAAQARRPAVIPVRGGGRVLVWSFGLASSGVPANWAASDRQPGVWFVAAASARAADQVVARVRADKRPGDVVVASVHWGSNWGYRVAGDQVRFAHRLIDGGVDVVHGHSSHHPRPIEVYRGKLVLYGCGDFIDDYEGITGMRRYRDDLRLAYFASVRPATGELTSLRMAPLRARQMRLCPAASRDATWLAATLSRISRNFGTRVDPEPAGLIAHWPTDA